MILYGIANGSSRVDCFRNQYRRVLLVWYTIWHVIANNSLKVNTSIAWYAQFCLVYLIALPGLIASGTSIARYTGLLLGGRTILSGIGNSSPSFRNQYRR